MFKINGLDLSGYLRVNPDESTPMDPYSSHFVEPSWADTPFSDGQVLISTTVQNRESLWPLFIVDPSHGKEQLHALIQQINNAGWRSSRSCSSGATPARPWSTFFQVPFARFEPDFNYRRSVHGYGAGVLHLFTSGYGHTGTVRVTATAAGTGVFLSVPIGSVAGDAPALLDTTVTAGAVVPSLGRVVAVAPITNPSYTPRIPAASLTSPQTNATLVGASGADGSQYLALPVSPTGGASGIACMVPLPNPTIAGGDNRILALVQSGINASIAINAIDPYGNSMGATSVASNSQGYALVDLGVCRLPTLGYPTVPQISILAGAVWASGGAGPNVLASPAALRINEIFCLPNNLTLIYERGQAGVGASVLSQDGFAGISNVPGSNDGVGNAWSHSRNDDFSPTAGPLVRLGGYAGQGRHHGRRGRSDPIGDRGRRPTRLEHRHDADLRQGGVRKPGARIRGTAAAQGREGEPVRPRAPGRLGIHGARVRDRRRRRQPAGQRGDRDLQRRRQVPPRAAGAGADRIRAPLKR